MNDARVVSGFPAETSGVAGGWRCYVIAVVDHNDSQYFCLSDILLHHALAEVFSNKKIVQADSVRHERIVRVLHRNAYCPS